MTTDRPQPPVPASAVLLMRGRRRRLFAALAELADWGIAPVDSLPIAAGSCGDDDLRRHVLGLHEGLQQGLTPVQAFEADGAFWGQRTLRVIRRHGEQRTGQAFHRLARGAGEPVLQRPLVSCFGISRRRTVVAVSVLSLFAALWLPILPHQRLADGRVAIAFFGRHESLIQGSYDLDLGAALARDAIALRDLEWEPGRGTRPRDRLRQVLVERTGDRRIASCIVSYAIVLPLLANAHHLVSSLDRLAPSPVPMVWFLRRIILGQWMARHSAEDVIVVTERTDAGYAQALVKLSELCPDIEPDRH
ncbi:MAG: hypothetical protein ACKO0M_00690 [Cyanobium sp.]